MELIMRSSDKLKISEEIQTECTYVNFKDQFISQEEEKKANNISKIFDDIVEEKSIVIFIKIFCFQKDNPLLKMFSYDIISVDISVPQLKQKL